MFVVKPSDPCGDSIADVHGLSGSSFEWVANVPAGTPVQFQIEDDDGNAGWSAALTVTDGDASCLSASSSSAPAETEAASSSARSSASSTSRSSTSRSTATDVPANVAGGSADSNANAAFSTRSLSGFAGLAVAAAAAVLAL